MKIVGESKREKHYKKKAKIISPKISILGSLSRKDIFKIYADSHVLILLSKSEGFPCWSDQAAQPETKHA